MAILLRALGASFLLPLSVTSADDFELYTNSVLAKVASSPDAAQVERIALSDLFKAKPVLPGENGCFVVLRTDEGNWAKFVLRYSFRKQADGEVPIVLIQRYQCMRPGTESGRLAAGKDVYLFDGFRFNLDIGQIVPDGGGGDIEFHREGESGGFVQPVGKAKLYVVHKPLVAAPKDQSGPTAGPVVAEDFAGKFHLMANGKWSGQLTLQVTKSGDVSGSYVSDQTGADYPVKGFVARPTHHIKFTIELPMARQEFDGRLWTQGKNALAGTMSLGGSEFGFVAVREGTELIPKDE